jgi:ABC-type Fe3+ transport system permease subunit
MEPNTPHQSQPYTGRTGQESLPNATVILVLGILSIVLCQPLGIAAWIMGNSSLSQYKQAPERYSESSLNTVKAGRICGIIGVCLILLFLVLFLAGVSLFSFMNFDR